MSRFCMINHIKRIRCSFLISSLALAIGVLSNTAHGHDARLGALHITHPATPATLPGQSIGVVYLSIENEGATEDRLLSVESPAASEVAIHAMSMVGTTMQMRELPNLLLPAATIVSLERGSMYHLMLTGLKQPLQNGDKIPLTLRFEHAGKIELSVHVGLSAAQKNK
jgi:copper(I)-binding protein